MKTLGTEMMAVASQFDKGDKSTKALAAQNEVLNKQIDTQKQKLAELQKGLALAADKYGENDKVTQGWQQQVNKATAELNNLEHELKSNNAELARAAEAGDKAGDELEEAGRQAKKSGSDAEAGGGGWDKVSGILKGVAVAAAAVAVAAGAAAVKLGKEVISAYADYEQLVGGVDTLFKESSAKLQTYAADAYKTAGLSANDYMETVTSFSASLISSLGGDTEKAVSYADMAITDMSDNANKMGTDMSMIQNAYQGFAKQNYTMLDNLKLGYGGTKTEMERLLADAEAISGIHYDVSSYADVVSAIHVIQENMGIAGTTALEAEHTISGSINSLKSAFQNMIVGLGNADADMTKLTQNLVDAFQSVVTNVTPIIGNLAAALPAAFDALLVAAGDILPPLLDTVAALFEKVLSTMAEMFPKLIPAVVAALMVIVNALIENLPLLVSAALTLVSSLVSGITQALPELVPAAIEIVLTLVDGLIDLLPELVTAALELIVALANGLIDALPEIIEKVPKIVNTIVDILIKNLPLIINAALQIIMALAAAMIKNLPLIIKAVIEIIGAIFRALVNGIIQIIAFVPKLFASLVGEFSKINWGELGINLIKGIASGVALSAKALATSVVDAAKGALDSAKSFLGISSPSKLMRDQVGKMVGMGMVEGITDSARQIRAAMQGLSSLIAGVDLGTPALAGAAAGVGSTGAVSNTYHFSFTGPINVRDDRDIPKIAREIYRLQKVGSRGRGN